MQTEPCSAQPSWVELRHLLQVECSIELVQAVACTQLNENVHDASKQFGVMQQDALYFEDTHTHILLHKMLFHCISHTTDHGAQDQASRRTTKTARSCSNSNSGSGKSARHATHIKQESLTWKPAQCNGSAARQYRAAEAGCMQKMPPEAIASS